MPGIRHTDESLFAAVEQAGSPQVDAALRRLSVAANHSRLWMGVAAGLALMGGPTGRRAAASGMVAVAITSATVNLGLKRAFPRNRPVRAVLDDPVRHVLMPESTSFPSGHSASAFAFAQAVSATMPWTGIGVRALATAVAYSRIHVGVHYPGDVIAGAATGSLIGQAVVAAGDRYV